MATKKKRWIDTVQRLSVKVAPKKVYITGFCSVDIATGKPALRFPGTVQAVLSKRIIELDEV